MNINDNLLSSESQKKRIFAHLMDGKRITSLEALKLFGCMHLASRISDIRRDHPEVNIQVVRIETPTKKKVAQYFVQQ